MSQLRTAVKRIRAKVAEGEVEEAATLLPQALKIIDKSANKKVIHPNAAARTKSRLVQAVSQSSE
jgi:small subunit ribosomal protein S20